MYQIYTKESNELQLTCRVFAHPPAVVEWYKNDQILEPEVHVMSVHGNDNSLLLTNISRTLPMESYECRATNNLGSASVFSYSIHEEKQETTMKSIFFVTHEENSIVSHSENIYETTELTEVLDKTASAVSVYDYYKDEDYLNEKKEDETESAFLLNYVYNYEDSSVVNIFNNIHESKEISTIANDNDITIDNEDHSSTVIDLHKTIEDSFLTKSTQDLEGDRLEVQAKEDTTSMSPIQVKNQGSIIYDEDKYDGGNDMFEEYIDDDSEESTKFTQVYRNYESIEYEGSEDLEGEEDFGNDEYSFIETGIDEVKDMGKDSEFFFENDEGISEETPKDIDVETDSVDNDTGIEELSNEKEILDESNSESTEKGQMSETTFAVYGETYHPDISIRDDAVENIVNVGKESYINSDINKEEQSNTIGNEYEIYSEVSINESEIVSQKDLNANPTEERSKTIENEYEQSKTDIDVETISVDNDTGIEELSNEKEILDESNSESTEEGQMSETTSAIYDETYHPDNSIRDDTDRNIVNEDKESDINSDINKEEQINTIGNEYEIYSEVTINESEIVSQKNLNANPTEERIKTIENDYEQSKTTISSEFRTNENMYHIKEEEVSDTIESREEESQSLVSTTFNDVDDIENGNENENLKGTAEVMNEDESINHYEDEISNHIDVVDTENESISSLEIEDNLDSVHFTSRADSDHTTKYTLEWLIISSTEVRECTVKFRIDQENQDWYYITAILKQDGADTFVGKVTLEHLKPGQRYVVHIATKNADNMESFSENFLFTTIEDEEGQSENSGDNLIESDFLQDVLVEDITDEISGSGENFNYLESNLDPYDTFSKSSTVPNTSPKAPKKKEQKNLPKKVVLSGAEAVISESLVLMTSAFCLVNA